MRTLAWAGRRAVGLRGEAATLLRQAQTERRWSNVTLGIGIAIVGALSVAGFFASLIASADPNAVDLTQRLLSPSAKHWMGTDPFGRDIFTRTLYAIRLDLVVVLIITYVPMVFGMIVGALAGYFRGWVDAITVRVIDAFIAFPFIVLVIAVVAILGPGLKGVYIGVLAVGWTLYARLTRGDMLVLREQQFILAARTLGYSPRRVILRHAIPNLIRSNLVFSMADIVLNLLLLAGLSYLGVGVQAPTAELGAMVADGQSFLQQAWWVTTLPGVVIVVLGAGFSMIGDSLADRLGQKFGVVG
ncbi:MAG: ABC transporter permease [bacterium]|nr:ABC transporter permease [bacterium]